MDPDDEITSLAFSPALGVPSGLWLAFGTRVAFFSLESKSLVMKLADAPQTHTLLTTLADESDVLNDVNLLKRFCRVAGTILTRRLDCTFVYTPCLQRRLWGSRSIGA